jgi:hypothetical protein
LSDNIGYSLGQFIQKGIPREMTASPVVHLGYRFIALSGFQGTFNPPINMSWAFLFIHQVIFEMVALKYPDVCASGKKMQTIQMDVNNDLKALLTAKTGVDYLKRGSRMHRAPKVTSFLLITDI